MEEEIVKINNKCQSRLNNLYNFLSEKLKNKYLFSLNTMYFLDGKMYFKVIFKIGMKHHPITGIYIMIDTTHTHHFYYSTPIIINTRIYKDFLFTNNEGLGYINNDYHKFSSDEEVLDELLRIYDYLIEV